MLCSLKELDGFELAARDADLGHARQAYFDDERWVIRHLVANTGGWLSGRDVLISPHSILRIDHAQRKLDVALSRQQIKDAPGIDTDKPVSRQDEMPYYDYYGYPYYWVGAGLWGVGSFPLTSEPLLAPAGDGPIPRDVAEELAAGGREAADSHLRSSAEVTGYDVQASDGAIGHIDDFLFDERSWQMRYAVVDTRNWLPGRRVLVAVASIASIDWSNRRANFAVTREAVKESPRYEASVSKALSTETERQVQRHYEGWQ